MPNELDLKLHDKYDLSILDDQYSVDYFNYVVHSKQIETDNVFSKLKDVLFSVDIINEIKDGTKIDTQYIVEMREEIKKAVEQGLVRFDKNKAGEIFAQIRDSKGKFSKKLSIKKQLMTKGVDMLELNNALQVKTIENQMLELIKVFGEISEAVSEIIQGQQNDRLGLYYSGVNLYLESRNMQDRDLQKLITSQALKSLSDSNAQMIQSIQTNIQYLAEKRHKSKKGYSALEIKERMIDINKSFETVFRSTIMKASICYEKNEIQAMLITMEEYGKFLNKVIIPNVQKLTEFDINDIYLESGIWERRAQSFLEMDRLKLKLTSNYEIKLESKEQNYA